MWATIEDMNEKNNGDDKNNNEYNEINTFDSATV